MNTNSLNESVIWDTLRQVIDPEIGCNIVDLGLVYSVALSDGAVKVAMTLTTPGCPMHESISWGVKNALLSLEGVTEVEVEIVWDPPWNPAMMTDAGRAMTGVRNP
jgi:metal-sulfur cluster biosynthetic enzyme